MLRTTRFSGRLSVVVCSDGMHNDIDGTHEAANAFWPKA